MSLRAFRNQLAHDLRVSWKKTASLGILLVIGMILWIPPLVRSVLGGASPRAATKRTGAARAEQASASAKSTTVSAEQDEAGLAAQTPNWSVAEEWLQTDPLLQTIDLGPSMQADPFRIDHDQFCPPVLLADEPPVENKPKKVPKPAGGPPKGLTLKSTFVSASRRAAVINDELYFEGQEISWQGTTYVLKAVSPSRVALTQGSYVFELHISPTK